MCNLFSDLADFVPHRIPISTRPDVYNYVAGYTWFYWILQ